MTLLCLDIGNTRIKWALYASNRVEAPLLANGAQFLENVTSLFDSLWSQFPCPAQAIGCSVASDFITRQVDHQLTEWGVKGRWIVPQPQEFGIINSYESPEKLGADRWVAMIAARHRLLTQGIVKPQIVVLVGTATTVEAIDVNGRFLGGIILPGHGIMLKAMQSGTARLSLPTGEVRAFPTNGSDGLTTGGTYAILGAIDRMIDNLKLRSGEDDIHITMTGGAAWKIVEHMRFPYELVDQLILNGLLLISQHDFSNY